MNEKQIMNNKKAIEFIGSILLTQGIIKNDRVIKDILEK